MGRKKSSDTPREDPAVRRLRERQFEELAELDEEENLRVKQALAAGRGFRAFRRAAGGGGAGGPIGTTTSTAGGGSRTGARAGRRFVP